MKILIAGLGSIGQRHTRNLRRQYGNDLEIIAHRVRGLPDVLIDGMLVAQGGTIEQVHDIASFESLEDALAEGPDVAFVCNPTSHHLRTALAAAQAGCHLFVEKPLSHDADQVDDLIAVVERFGLVATVGYQLRFHPALIRLRQLLSARVVGRIVSVRAEFGEYLPAAHPYEDYRQSYAARAELGGGVILCYIHEVDYLCWLFGSPHRVFTAGGRLGPLEIDVEDTAVSTLAFMIDGRSVPVQLQQSFLRQPPSRHCTIVGELGTIDLDLIEPSVTVSKPESVRREAFEGFRRNQLFEDELAHFMAAIANQTAPVVSLRDAAKTLDVALAMRESLATGQAVEIR